jgi:carbon storage regulator
MLILSRKIEESIIINGDVEIKILDMSNGIVKVGIIAPKTVEVHRKEIYEKIREENKASSLAGKALNQLLSKK